MPEILKSISEIKFNILAQINVQDNKILSI